jgi:hypothetical protein
MPGPPPKRTSRVRNQQAMSSWTTLPSAGRLGKPPALPSKRPAWSKATRVWWSKIWSSPMATQWREDDDELVRLALLREAVWDGEYTAALLAELRALEDRHGLNPLARLKLRWAIEGEDEPAGSGKDATVVELRRRRGQSKRPSDEHVYDALR